MALLGIKQEELAKRSGVSQVTIHKILTGKTRETRKLAAIARALETTVDQLINEDVFDPGVDEKGNLPDGMPSTRPGIDIPMFNVRASMGLGYPAPDHEEAISRIRISREWLHRSVIFSAPGNLAIITGFGDSMEGTFSDGDILLIDLGVTEIKIDAVYVLSLNDQLYIKRLQRRPDGSLLMISDNRRYDPYLITNSERESCRVLGRVLLAWNARKL